MGIVQPHPRRDNISGLFPLPVEVPGRSPWGKAIVCTVDLLGCEVFCTGVEWLMADRHV